MIAERIAYLIRERAKACCIHPELVTAENYMQAVRALQRSLVEVCDDYARKYLELSADRDYWEDVARRHGNDS